MWRKAVETTDIPQQDPRATFTPELRHAADPAALINKAGSAAKTPEARNCPEIDLLVVSARTVMDSETTERLKSILAEDLDWEILLEEVWRHGTLPQLYWSLTNVGWENVPDAARSRITGEFQKLVWRNLSLTRELVKLLQLLEMQGIQALPFKGPVLAASIYGDVSLRFFCDLDILVRESDVSRAKDVLLSQGYKMPARFEDPHQTVRFLSRKKDYKFINEKAHTVVELHWRFTGKRFFSSIDTGRIWGRLERIPFAGTTVFNIPPDDLLLLLCVHGGKHCYERLQWVCDIAELIRVNQNLEWARIYERACTMGCERMLSLGLWLNNELLGAPLPEEILLRINADPASLSLATEMGSPFLRKVDRSGKSSRVNGFHVMNAFHIKMRERLRDKVRLAAYYGLRSVQISVRPGKQDRALLPLPRFLSFLHYVFRPIRLITKYGLKSFMGRRL